ncbi:MAG: GH32 C-terminal domain-containing protein [Bacteroidaceae bacterium]|nr:GH32 C-terminal domain-containing protein [Bacteroidaceae bacterium]
MKCFFLMTVLAALPWGGVCEAQTVTPQACEQSIVTPQTSGRYLWLPIEEKAPEGKVLVIADGKALTEQNVHMAREQVDYYVALDLQPYLNKNGMKVCVQNVPTGSICFKKLVQNDDADYALKEEPFRPAYHHTPKRGWMNDPNGMFYLDGVWHLFYQYNPYGSMWGNMHWGHSTSTDLIHWQHEPVALTPDAWGTMFSGSCVVDKEGTAGFGKGAVVAMYTASRPTPFGGDVQAQCLAYSTDGGKTFTKYEGNPVLTAEDKDFRDPNMFWNEDIKAWNLILAVGQEMRIYSSPDLKKWTEESRFGEGLGGHGGVWECPDLIQLPIVNGKSSNGKSAWVLLCNINPGGPFGGSATQYFVGDFDGHTFTVDDASRYTDGKALWMDYGKDHYATVSWSNAPEGRKTVIAWMSNWEYANDVPTRQFRSANSIARDLFLYQVGKEYFLGSQPAKEYDGKGLDKTYKVKGSTTITLTNAEGDEFSIIYDQKAMTLTCDRTKCGDTSFSDKFHAVTVAPVHRKLTSIRVFIDNCSVEVFGNNGEVVLTNLIFPKSKLNQN